MKETEKREIRSSKGWVKIVYHSSSTHGQIIIKEMLFDRQKKKFDKLFKNTDYVVIRGYEPNWEDIMNSALSDYRSIRSSMLFRKNCLERWNHTDYDEYNEIEKKIKIIDDRIKRIERKLKHGTKK